MDLSENSQQSEQTSVVQQVTPNDTSVQTDVTVTPLNGEKPLKLNWKRTFLVAFAFFGILLMWQVYDNTCSKLLEQQFMHAFGITDEKQIQYLVGIVMALDNVAALIMMPIFGRLSDKTHTRWGKRMPYILIGTIVCAILFPFIPLMFDANNVVGLILIMAVVVFFAMAYRNPAVSLMPDMTPKPLRSKANGIINIVGYMGGLVATLAGMAFVLTKYLAPGQVIYQINEVIPQAISVNGVNIAANTEVTQDLVNQIYGVGTTATAITNPNAGHWGNVWIAEAPFLIASVFMIASVLVLFFTIKENKIAVEVKDEMEQGEREAELVDKVDTSSGLSKTNKMMLWLILIAEFFWFMAENGISTFLTNYSTNEFGADTTKALMMTILGGAGSVIGFIVAPIVAGKIGRKWTLFSGLSLTLLMYALWMILSFTPMFKGASKLPWMMYVIWLIKGFGMSMVHVNSFPMVVELCTGDKIGKYTGYYYTASMAAQTVTPVALGSFLLVPSFGWEFLPIYATVCMVISAAVFFFVPNVKLKKTTLKKGLEALDQD